MHTLTHPKEGTDVACVLLQDRGCNHVKVAIAPISFEYDPISSLNIPNGPSISMKQNSPPSKIAPLKLQTSLLDIARGYFAAQNLMVQMVDRLEMIQDSYLLYVHLNLIVLNS